MKKNVTRIGYLGIIIFLLLNILNKMVTVSDIVYVVIMVISLIMFIPLCIQEVLSLKDK